MVGLTKEGDSLTATPNVVDVQGKETAGTACVDLLFKEDADMSDVVCGFFHAHLLQKELQKAGWTDKPTAPRTGTRHVQLKPLM